MRIGIGYDIHPLVSGRPLILGGVEILYEKGLDGHSDADVLTHSVIDAVLGAAGEGDIGHHFGVSDPQYRDVRSLHLLEESWHRVKAKGFRIGNVDVTVVAEAPRLAPHLAGMAANVSQALEVETARINIKPTTAKGLGPLGSGEGIACLAVVLLVEEG
ncbi:MAG: 2-C-methyl-D-erythritol 2,4-cyclodiphosphate synthase [Candidatus Methylomirabilales bacterium]|nr:2-C-methyl-D-erythritol 2,4-cyclodiphosphate synthase [candidate division NC10 bacterium]